MEERKEIANFNGIKLVRVIKKYGSIYSVDYVIDSWFSRGVDDDAWFLMDDRVVNADCNWSIGVKDECSDINTDDYEIEVRLVPKERTRIFVDVEID